MQMKRIFKLLLLLLCLGFSSLSAQEAIRSFDELVHKVTPGSLTLKSGAIRLSQAEKAKLNAIYGIVDPAGSVSGSYTNNTILPVTILPAEVNGGEPGTYQKIYFGVQYVTNFNAYAEMKLLNLQGWENLRLSKINIRLQESDNKISLQNWQENIAVVYFNIITLQEQLKATELHLQAADTLYQYTLQKFRTGLVNQQDINDSKASKLNIEESIRQIQFLVSQQYLALKILCDIPENEPLVIKQEISTELRPGGSLAAHNDLLVANALIREDLAKAAYRHAKYAFSPSFSFFGAYQNQQYNKQRGLFDKTTDWYPSSYVGFRLNIPIPASHQVAETSKTKYNYLMALNNTQQTKIQAGLNTKILHADYQKAQSQSASNYDIYLLRKDTYFKNLRNYYEGVLPLEQTIQSFNAMVNSNYSFISSSINILLAETKIRINNNIN